jgi:hypothetical protein
MHHQTGKLSRNSRRKQKGSLTEATLTYQQQPRKETNRQDEVSKTAPCVTKRGSYREILEENKKTRKKQQLGLTNRDLGVLFLESFQNQERKLLDRIKSQKPPHASPSGEAIDIGVLFSSPFKRRGALMITIL